MHERWIKYSSIPAMKILKFTWRHKNLFQLLPHCFLQGNIFRANIFTVEQTILTLDCCHISRHVFQATSYEICGLQYEIESLKTADCI